MGGRTPPENRIAPGLVAEHELCRVSRTELQEDEDPEKSCDSFLGGWDVAFGDPSLALRATALCVGNDDVEHGAVDPALVFPEIKSRACKQGRKEQDIGGVVENAWELFEFSIPLEIRQSLLPQSVSPHERRKKH